jgi:gas vesicle protein
MADGFDRSDNDSNGGGSFVMGLLTGTVLGAGLGMLFAPKAGAELRNQVREQAGNLANTASDGYRRAAETASQYAGRAAETASQYAERGRDMAGDLAGRAREAVEKGTEEAQRYVRDATSDMKEKIGTPSSGSGTLHPGGSQSGSGGFGGPRG